jgi:DeoR/GlpR family transcriptional regulator of sugar metabolism
LEPFYAQSAGVHPAEKRRIGAAAAALVEQGDTVFVNSGTTTAEVLRQVAARPDLTQATIITTNVVATLDLRHPGIEVHLLGGLYRPQSNAVVGDTALRALEQVYADKAVLGVDGFSLKRGLTTPVLAEAEIARLMLARTLGDVVVVADSSKWGVVSNYEIGAIEQVQVLVSDDALPADAADGLAGRGLRVIRAVDPAETSSPARLAGVAAREGPNGHH